MSTGNLFAAFSSDLAYSARYSDSRAQLLQDVKVGVLLILIFKYFIVLNSSDQLQQDVLVFITIISVYSFIYFNSFNKKKKKQF